MVNQAGRFSQLPGCSQDEDRSLQRLKGAGKVDPSGCESGIAASDMPSRDWLWTEDMGFMYERFYEGPPRQAPCCATMSGDKGHDVDSGVKKVASPCDVTEYAMIDCV